MQRSFGEILASWRSGNQAAAEDLFGPLRPLLRLQATVLLGRQLSARMDPSDVVQEAMIQAFQSREQFRGQREEQWIAWLRCMVAGHVAKVLRYHHAERRDSARDIPLSDTTSLAQQEGPDDHAIEQEEAARLATVIEELPERMREVVVRRVFHHQPFNDIAQELRTTPGATRIIWTRALRKLRTMLEGQR